MEAKIRITARSSSGNSRSAELLINAVIGSGGEIIIEGNPQLFAIKQEAPYRTGHQVVTPLPYKEKCDAPRHVIQELVNNFMESNESKIQNLLQKLLGDSSKVRGTLDGFEYQIIDGLFGTRISSGPSKDHLVTINGKGEITKVNEDRFESTLDMTETVFRILGNLNVTERINARQAIMDKIKDAIAIATAPVTIVLGLVLLPKVIELFDSEDDDDLTPSPASSPDQQV